MAINGDERNTFVDLYNYSMGDDYFNAADSHDLGIGSDKKKDRDLKPCHQLTL